MTLQHISQFVAKPAKKPEDAIDSVTPVNASTGLPYQGNNVAPLIKATKENKYVSPQWATFKQWNALNERVRKGEKGTAIFYYDTRKEVIEDKIEKIPFRKRAFVFNRCQLQRAQSDK